MLKTFKKWLKNNDAVIAIETGMLMPVMLTVMLGTIDTGQGILVSQKVINSVHTISDLLGRIDSVTTANVNDFVEAGRLIMAPYDVTNYGVDIAGIQYNGGPTLPVVRWRDTINMDPNVDILNNANDLGVNQEGVLGVTVRYVFVPPFSSVLTGNIEINEVTYTRGRKGLYIPRV